MLYLVEHFLSFQGEGKYNGSPSIFFRFGGCNLACKGFGVVGYSNGANEKIIGCDSLYAVDKKSFLQEWLLCKDADELIEKVRLLTKGLSYKPDIVITGGEPLINHKDPIFYEFIQRLLGENFRISVETNASLEVDFARYPLYKELIFAMSIKLSNSGESFKKRVNHKAIEAICQNSKEAFFKFVIDKEMIEDKRAKEEIEEITTSYKKEIYCMPIGKNIEELSFNDESVANFCIANGYKYTDRIHIRLWNDKKGV